MYSLRKLAAATTIAGLLVGALPAVAATTPTITLSSQASGNTSDNPIMVMVAVSDPVTDLDPADFAVNGGAITNFSGSGTSYSFGIVPGDGDPLHSHEARDVAVHIDANRFNNGDSAASNYLTWHYDTSAPSSTPADTTAPVITITSGPANGSTVASGDFTFAFSVDDASSTVQCSIVDASSTNLFYACGTPQAFTGFGNGTYRFAVKATDGSNNTGNANSTFMVAIGSSTATSSAVSVTIDDPSPANGSTVASTTSLSYYFTATSGATTMCTFKDVADMGTTTAFACGSPVTGLGVTPGNSYQFAVTASMSGSSASASRTVTVSTTSAPTTPPADNGSGGGSTQTTSPSTAPASHEGGIGSAIGGPESGHAVLPGQPAASGSGSTSGTPTGNAVIPTVPTQTQSNTGTTGSVSTGQTTSPSSGTGPVVSQSSGGSALVPTTPGTPNTGSGDASVSDDQSITSPTTTDESFGIPTSSLGAAVATTDTGIPGWVWLVLAGLVLIGVGVWALRQPVENI